MLCGLLRRDPGGSSRSTLPSKDWGRGVLGSCCLTGFALGSWFTHTELRSETLSVFREWVNLSRVRIWLNKYNPIQKDMGVEGLRKEQLECKRTEVSVKQR